MRKIIFGLLFLPTILFGQDKKFEVGFGIGSNGQLDKLLNDFYYWGHETAYLDDSYYADAFNLKFSISGRFFLSESASVRLKLGKSRRKDFYTKINPGSYIDYSIDQDITNANPSICLSKRFDRFEIMTGLEVPLIFVGGFKFVSIAQTLPDSITVTSEIRSTRSMDGGFIWGLNNFIGVKYFFLERVALSGEINYGLLFANIGNNSKFENEDILPTQTYSMTERKKKFKKSFFSPPEVSLGITYAFGK